MNKFHKKNKKRCEGGFSFIEILIGIALLLVVSLGLYGAFQLCIQLVGQSKARITALSLASQQMEMIRNLPYNSVGTQGGIPTGSLLQSETIIRNDIEYELKTSVIYIDDPFDGTAPADTLAKDYKRVRTEVSWIGRLAPKEPVILITDIVPKGIETEAGGGTLSVSVFDASGIGVGQAEVHIVNNQVFPPIDAYYQTDNQGRLVLAGAPTSTESYQISVSKSNYSSSQTYGTEEVTSPDKPHGSVYEGDLTEVSFAIDALADLSVETKGTEAQGYPPIYNAPFTIIGAKTIGTDSEGETVYKYEENKTTDGLDFINITGIEWDSYSFFVDKASTGLDLTTTTPAQPIDLLPGAAQSIALILTAENTLLASIADASSTAPVFGAEIRLFNLGIGYDQVIPSGENGKAFFIPLENKTYNLEIKKGGYFDYSGAVFVSGDTAKTVNLIPEP